MEAAALRVINAATSDTAYHRAKSVARKDLVMLARSAAATLTACPREPNAAATSHTANEETTATFPANTVLDVAAQTRSVPL